MNTTPSGPSDSGQPSWGTAPSTPPASSGSDTGPGTGSEAPRAPVSGAPFFNRIRALGIVRPDDDRWAAGVAAGLARRWNVHPAAVRIGFVVLTLLGGFGVPLYGLGWLFLPHPDGRIHAQQVLLGKVTAGFFGAALAILLGAPDIRGPWLALLLLGLLVWRLGGQRGHGPARGC